MPAEIKKELDKIGAEFELYLNVAIKNPLDYLYISVLKGLQNMMKYWEKLLNVIVTPFYAIAKLVDYIAGTQFAAKESDWFFSGFGDWFQDEIDKITDKEEYKEDKEAYNKRLEEIEAEYQKAIKPINETKDKNINNHTD